MNIPMLDNEDRTRISRAFLLMHDHLSEIALEEEDLSEWASVEWGEYIELAQKMGIGTMRDVELPDALISPEALR